jgi:hypothetical protein
MGVSSASPLVSVVLPTRNRADYLPEAVHSVLNQSWGDFELIVVDDGSTDATAEITGGIVDARVRYVFQASQGRSAARNYGVRLAQGEFVGFLDSDDRYLSGALAAHLQVLTQQPDLGLTLGGYQYVSEDGRPGDERCPWNEGGGLNVAGWLTNCYGMPGSIMVRRAWLERAQGFDPELHMAEDWDLFLRLAYAGCPMDWVRQSVCQYRRHGGGSIREVAVHRNGALQMLDKFFAQPGLPPEIRRIEASSRAWASVVFSRRAYVAGQAALGTQALQEALVLDPDLAGPSKMRLLEFLVAPDPDMPPGFGHQAEALAGSLPPGLAASRGDLRQALARAEMAQFFQAAGRRADAEALGHLKAGVRQDPRWLANRGVLAFSLRSVLRSLQSRT